MANCNLCGKRMGIFEDLFSQFPGDTGVCNLCLDKLQHVINPHIEDLQRIQTDKEQAINIIIKTYATNKDASTYLSNYINIQWEEIKNKISVETQQEPSEKFQLYQKALTLKITTGYSFDNYKITEYKGVISGETVLRLSLINEFISALTEAPGMNSNSFAIRMRKVKEEALNNLKMQAALVGGSAVIGVDFDYLTFSNDMIGVSANGTAVVIEKIEE